MDTIDNARQQMNKTLTALRTDLAKIRSGRAHVGLLESVKVNCYGADMPLSQTSTVSVVDTRTLLVAPWDAQNTAAIEKALRESDLGLNAAATSGGVRVSLPPLSEERRHELTKVVGKEAETARIAVRNTRREAMTEIKSKVKNKDIGEDEGRRLEQQVDKVAEEIIQAVEDTCSKKQQELLKI